MHFELIEGLPDSYFCVVIRWIKTFVSDTAFIATSQEVRANENP